MFFSAVSLVSLFEVDDNTDSSVGIGEKTKQMTVCFVVPY